MSIEDAIQTVIELTGDDNFKRKASLVFEEYANILILLEKENPHQTAINQIKAKYHKLFEYSSATRSYQKKILRKKLEKLNKLKGEISSIDYAKDMDHEEKIRSSLKVYEVEVIENELNANKHSVRLLMKMELIQKVLKVSLVVVPLLLTIFWGLIMFTIGLNIATKNIQNWIFIAGIIIPTIAWILIEFIFSPWYDRRKKKFVYGIVKNTIGHLCHFEMFLQCHREIVRFRNNALNPNKANSADAKSRAAD